MDINFVSFSWPQSNVFIIPRASFSSTYFSGWDRIKEEEEFSSSPSYYTTWLSIRESIWWKEERESRAEENIFSPFSLFGKDGFVIVWRYQLQQRYDVTFAAFNDNITAINIYINISNYRLSYWQSVVGRKNRRYHIIFGWWFWYVCINEFRLV